MLLRRAALLASLIAYLGVGVCREACAIDLRAAAPDHAAAASGCARCREKAPASRRPPKPCCASSAHNEFALLSAPAALPPAPVFAGFIRLNAPAAILAAAAPSVFVSRAPPRAAPLVLAQPLVGPRPPPSLLAVL